MAEDASFLPPKTYWQEGLLAPKRLIIPVNPETVRDIPQEQADRWVAAFSAYSDAQDEIASLYYRRSP